MEPSGKYDLLIKGGHVIDPANKIDGLMDVAVKDGKIAKVAPDIPSDAAEKVANAQGRYVTPGLIDIHGHCYPLLPRGPQTLAAIDAGAHVLKEGVTTLVDAGTVGWRDFVSFKESVIDVAKTRVLAFLNIACGGMVDKASEQRMADLQPKVTAEVISAYPDILVGIKTAHYHGIGAGAPSETHPAFGSIDRALEAGALCGKPTMVDFQPNGLEQSYRGLLKRMGKGDIHTHVFAQQFPIVDENGKVYDHMWEARERGVKFDVGHGAASFWFRNGLRALRDGFAPDTLSTDLHMGNIHGVVLSQLHILGKYHNMGMSLAECVARSTTEAARLIGRPDLGTLNVGACADVAVIRKIEGDFDYIDCGRARIKGTSELLCEMTVREGNIVYDGYGLSMPLWEEAPQSYWQTRHPVVL